MIEVEISAEQVEPPSCLPDLSSLTTVTLESVAMSDADIRVLFCDRSRISELNAQFRDREGATDVLTFPEDGPSNTLSGDIAICEDEVEANASEFQIPVAEELCRVYVHALLHLAGYDHGTTHLGDENADQEPMFVIQEQIVDRYTKERNGE